MYMFGRLRTASRPSSTLIASVPYSSAPFCGRAVFSAVSREFPRSSRRVRACVGSLWFLAGAPAGFNARVRRRNPRNHSRNEGRDHPFFDPEEAAPGPRCRLEQPAVGGGEEPLCRQGAEVGEEEAVLRRIELGRDVVEQEEGRTAERRPEVLDLRDLEGEHERALLALAPVEPRAAAAEREREVVHVRAGRGVAPLAVAAEPTLEDLRERLGELDLGAEELHAGRGAVGEERLRCARPGDLGERGREPRRELLDERATPDEEPRGRAHERRAEGGLDLG